MLSIFEQWTITTGRQMKENSIRIEHSILISRPRDVVWDYTQGYDNRAAWDDAILEASVMQTSPNRVVKLRMRGNTVLTFSYKLDDRPNRTTLVAVDIASPVIASLGGSWIYEDQEGNTLWTQKGTIVLKDSYASKLLLPFYRLIFNMLTRYAMKKAKRQIERL